MFTENTGAAFDGLVHGGTLVSDEADGRRASASRDGSRNENETSGSGCSAIEEKEDNVAPWYVPSCNLATTTETGCAVPSVGDWGWWKRQAYLWNMSHRIPHIVCYARKTMVPPHPGRKR